MDKEKYESIYNKILIQITKNHGKGETYGNFLKKVGQQMFGNKFVGVYPSNRIPKLKSKSYCIVNLDKSHHKGSHWVGMIKDKSVVYVYDSFGRKTYKILPNLKKQFNNIQDTEYDAEQKESEHNCGQRCLAFIYIYDNFGWKAAKFI